MTIPPGLARAFDAIFGPKLLTRWESRGGKYWFELYVENYNDKPSYFYKGEGCGGNLGTITEKDAYARAQELISYYPSKLTIKD